MRLLINQGRYERTNLITQKHDIDFALGTFQHSRGLVSGQTAEPDGITEALKIDGIKKCFNKRRMFLEFCGVGRRVRVKTEFIRAEYALHAGPRDRNNPPTMFNKRLVICPRSSDHVLLHEDCPFFQVEVAMDKCDSEKIRNPMLQDKGFQLRFNKWKSILASKVLVRIMKR
jgi:hypothetical protein